MTREEYVAKRFAEIQAKSTGEDYIVSLNPVLAQILGKEHENLTRNTLAAIPDSEDAAKKAAIRSVCGAKPPKDLDAQIKAHKSHRTAYGLTAGPVAPLPTSYDSRDYGWVPPIRNQASCGSCWCFSAFAATEASYAKANNLKGADIDFSEQEVLSCGPNGGCNGDWPSTAFTQIGAHGVQNESAVPYQADSGNGQCHTGGKAVLQSATPFLYLGDDSSVPSADKIKQAIMDFGAVSIAVAVDDTWAAYSTGIFTGTGYTEINHAVDYVGWGVDSTGKEFFILRNHWGSSSWGEAGYMRTRHGANQAGYGAAVACALGNSPVPPIPPVPPVPPTPPGPTPTPVVAPIYDLELSGPGGFLKLSGTATPRAGSALGFDWGSFIATLLKDAPAIIDLIKSLINGGQHDAAAEVLKASIGKKCSGCN